MDLLIFERKRGIPQNYKRPVLVPDGEYRGILIGDQVIVTDSKEADDLNMFGCYGEYLQRREPHISLECFDRVQEQRQQGYAKIITVETSNVTADDGGSDNDNEGSSAVAQKSQRIAEAWKRLWPEHNSLCLGMEEALYLSSELGVLRICSGDQQFCDLDKVWKKFYNYYGIRFVRRYAAYRYFRQQGWVVRPGLPYGVDFMLYRDGPEYYHSSAAVRIVSGDGCRRDASWFVALNRELNNMKKTLIEVTAAVPLDIDLKRVDCIQYINVTHSSAYTWKTSDDQLRQKR